MTSSWDASLETGNELIDRQHREVIDLLDELREVQSGHETDVLAVLDKVMEFTLFHFTAEELLMTEVEYPAELSLEMIEQHKEFKDYARLRILEFRREEMACVTPLHGFLDEWLKIHEFGMDRLFTDWIRGRNSA